MKKNFTVFRSVMMLICILLMVQTGIAQRTVIAGWTFANTTSIAEDPTYAAQCGDGIIYLDGSFGSDTWTIGTGSSVNNNATFYMGGIIPTEAVCGEETTGDALGLGGNGNNGHSIVFAITTTGLQDIMLSYDFKRTRPGFNTATWSHSTDGVSFTTDTTITDETTYAPASSSPGINYIIDFSNATDINDQDTVYLRLTVDGATSATGNNRYDNILITGAAGVPSAIQPDFSVASGSFCIPFEVTMSSETENASIYYTLDGSEPDNVNGILYEGPVTISSTCDLRAKAYSDTLGASFETSATYTFPAEIATISDFKALTTGYYKLTCPVTAVFQSTNYLFVEDDAHTGLCIYKQGGFSTNYINGEVITDGICGTRSVLQNIKIMTSPEFVNPIATSGTPIEPVAVTMAQLRTNWDTYDSRLVTLSNITFEQGIVGASTSSYLKIYQNNDSLGCANTLGTIAGYTAPVSFANVTGFALHNPTIKLIAPRGTNDIVDLLPSLSIVSPAEGESIEQGTPIQVDLEIENFNFENGSMIECKLLADGEAVSTQYLHNDTELTEFETTDITTLMTTFGEHTIIASLVDAENQQFTIPATDTVHFSYDAVYIAIETSESALAFTETGESHTFTVTGFRLDEAITLTVDNDAFTVSPSTLPDTADADIVTVTFNGDATATGTLTLTSGTTVATVALSAVIPIDELILSVGFEPNEGFSNASYYQNDDPYYFGADGRKWGVVHGCVATSGAISGTQSMQMRYYCSSSSDHYGHTGYTFTNFDVHNVTKVEFDAKVSTNSNMKLLASFSHDGGETYEGDSIFIPTASAQRFTYNITDSGQYYSVRVKFAMVLPETVTQTSSTLQLHIDSVDFYGVTGLEPSVVETPVISETSGNYIDPLTVSITCETEGARIYYTTDGTTPNESSSLYDTPLTISSSCTLKAKAFKGGMDPSNTATAEYKFPVEVANIADFKAAGANDDNVTYKITGDVTFVYRNARRIFIEDATGGLLVYDNSTPVVTDRYNEGDVISGGIIGKYTVYNGMSEMLPSADWAEASGNVTVTPTMVTTADITGDFATYEARLVRINAGIFSDEASFNTNNITEATFTDSIGEIVFRNQFKTLDTTVNAGDSADVIGLAAIFVTDNGTTYQLFPRTNADIIPIISEPEDTTDIPDDTVSIRTYVPLILTVYPNPATDMITVSADHDGGSLEILNAFGQVVYRAKGPVYPMTVNMSDKAAGLYFVRVITADNRIAIVKISKK